MPDQEHLDDFLEALEEAGSPAKNPALREALGWEEPLYEEVKAALVAKGIVKRGQGRSDTVFLADAEQVVQQATQAKAPRHGKAAGPHCQERSPLGLTHPPGGLTDDHETDL